MQEIAKEGPIEQGWMSIGMFFLVNVFPFIRQVPVNFWLGYKFWCHNF